MDPARKRILIVEDEPDIASSLKYNLEREGGYLVTTAETGENGLAEARRRPFDAAILDLMLPGMDGLEVCRALRAAPATRRLPILMLTARVDESDKLVGLEMGADDYMTKPFSMKELMARLRALLRRSATVEPSEEQPYQDSELEMDFEAHVLRLRGREIGLTRMEFALLAALIRSHGRVLGRDHLLQKVWGYDYHGGSRTVDVHVRRIRQKLGSSGERIETVFGVGYRFRGSGSSQGDD